MAQIPDFTALGERPVPTSSRSPVVDNSGQIIAQAVSGLGDSITQATNEHYIHNVNMARAQSENALLDHELAVKTLVEHTKDQVASGELPYAKARETFDQNVAKIEVPDVPNLDPEGRMNLQRQVKRTVATSQFQIDHVIDTAKSDDFKGQFGENLDKLGKLAGMPGANIEEINARAESFRSLAREAGLPAAFVDKTLQDFKDKNWLNQATQRSMEARESLPALRNLEHELTDADGFYAGKLDTDKRNVVLNETIGHRIALERKQREHLSDLREELHEQINDVHAALLDGRPISQQDLPDASKLAFAFGERGKHYAKQMNEAAALSNSVQSFHDKTNDELKAELISDSATKRYAANSSPQDNFQRNSAYAVAPPAGGYLTKLSSGDETKFEAWASKNKVPVDNSAQSDYDMRGFWKGLTTGDPHAQSGVDQNDGKLHYSDYWKTPYHKTFSAESKFAAAGAPKWNAQDQLVLPNGKVVFDDKAQGSDFPKSKGGVTGAADEAALRNYKKQIITNIVQQREADPATYITSTSPVAAQAAQDLSKDVPGSGDRYFRAVNTERQRLGIQSTEIMPTDVKPGGNEWQKVALLAAKTYTLLPKEATQWADTGLRSSDPQVASQAARFVANAENVSHDAASKIGADERTTATQLNRLLDSGSSADSAMETIKESRILKPEVVKAREQKLTNYVKQNPGKLDSFVDEFDPGIFTFQPSVSPEMQADFDNKVKSYYLDRGDIDVARKRAWDDLKRVYSPSTVNGKLQMLLLPPEKFGMKPDEVRKDIADLVSAHPQPDGSTADDITLVPSSKTIRQTEAIMNGEQITPSYRLVTKSGDDFTVDGVKKEFALPSLTELAAKRKSEADAAREKDIANAKINRVTARTLEQNQIDNPVRY